MTLATAPYNDQRPGTAGLRKQVTVFQQSNYLENFIQAIFDAQSGFEGETLVIGGDGRYFSETAIPTIIRMAAANGFARVILGQNGLLSTPNSSLAIRKYGAFGGIILTASHNPGGPAGDFGVKYSMGNGSLATEALTGSIYAHTQSISEYKTSDIELPNISRTGEFSIDDFTITILDTVADYAELMGEHLRFRSNQITADIRSILIAI